MNRLLWTAALAAVMAAPAASSETGTASEGAATLSRLSEKAMALKSVARTPVDGEASPLYAHVTRQITARMSAEIRDVAAAPAALPTLGPRCATTAPTCGRPTAIGCRPRPTTGCVPTTAPTCGTTLARCRPITTAITCGCPPATTAPTCGQPTFGCPPRPTLNGCFLTTAITCGCRP